MIVGLKRKSEDRKENMGEKIKQNLSLGKHGPSVAFFFSITFLLKTLKRLIITIFWIFIGLLQICSINFFDLMTKIGLFTRSYNPVSAF